MKSSRDMKRIFMWERRNCAHEMHGTGISRRPTIHARSVYGVWTSVRVHPCRYVGCMILGKDRKILALGSLTALANHLGNGMVRIAM